MPRSPTNENAIAGDLASLANDGSLFAGRAREKLQRLQAELEPLSERYDIVVANPPYMGSKNMNKWLGDWVKAKYPDVKSDLFSCFMVRNSQMGNDHAQMGFMTPYVWVFISSYEKLRKFVTQENTITSLIQLEYSGFAGATVPICTFTLQKGYLPSYKGGYIRLSDFVGADQQAPRALEALANPDCGWFYRCSADVFEAVPGSPIAYWASSATIVAFTENRPLNSIAKPRQGLATSDNNRFLRLWWEISDFDFGLNLPTREQALASKKKWFPCNKGGGFRKWYGNNEYVVNWENDGKEMLEYAASLYGSPTRTIKNIALYFREGITWGSISSADLSMRYSPKGYIFETKGSMCFADNHEILMYLLGFTNSVVVKSLMKILSPTLDFHEGPMGNLPVIKSATEVVVELVEDAVPLAKGDWDAYETSWDFKRHPLV